MENNTIIGNRIFLLVLFVLLTGFAFQFSPIPAESKTYPLVILIASYMLAIFLFIHPVKQPIAGTSDKMSMNPTFLLRFLVFAGFVLLYILLIDKIGYLIASLAFTLGSLVFLRIRNKLLLTIFPIVITLFAYILFAKILGVFLPEGKWITFYF